MQRQANLTVIATSIAASAATLMLALAPALMSTSTPVASRAATESLRVVELPRVVVSAARELRVVELPRVVIQAQRTTATADALGAAATPLQPVMSRQPS